MELEQNLQESQYREQQLELTNNNLKRHLNQITEEKEEREKEAVSCFNALEVNISLSECTKSSLLPLYDHHKHHQREECLFLYILLLMLVIGSLSPGNHNFGSVGRKLLPSYQSVR